MKILVVGGAGFIGSHLAKRLALSGHKPIVLDNLCSGYADAARYGQLMVGDAGDAMTVRAVLDQHPCDAVMHFASHIQVGESVTDPAKYYANNVVSTLELLKVIREAGVRHLIFSSTAAVYGLPEVSPIPETHRLAPINPYGRSKRMVEEVLADFDAAYGVKSVVLRYFNAAGADPEGELGERHEPETHLIPLVLQVAAGRRSHLSVFGRDYPTRDGTCIRDYIHVTDLANAHELALNHLVESRQSNIFNLGTGSGYSVQEVIDEAASVTGRSISTIDMPRRPGDPAELVADPSQALRELRWRPSLSSLGTMIEHAWRWELDHGCPSSPAMDV